MAFITTFWLKYFIQEELKSIKYKLYTNCNIVIANYSALSNCNVIYFDEKILPTWAYLILHNYLRTVFDI